MSRFVGCLSLVLLFLFTIPAAAEFQRYDDFNGESVFLDPSLWALAQVTGGNQLDSVIATNRTVYSPDFDGQLIVARRISTFINATGVTDTVRLNILKDAKETGIKAKATLFACSVPGTSSAAEVRILHSAFHQVTVPNGQQGDYVGQIGLRCRSGVETPEVYYRVTQCQDATCSTSIVLNDATIIPAELGQAYTISSRRNGEDFEFVVDGEPPVLIKPTAQGLQVIFPAPVLRFAQIGTRVAGSSKACQEDGTDCLSLLVVGLFDEVFLENEE